MAFQRQRRTQTAEYWRDEFSVDKEDIERLYDWLVEEGEPRNIEELSQKAIEHRCQKEEMALSRQRGGQIFLPQDTYEVGQRVVFPALDYAIGQVLTIRTGNNPRYGGFKVIQVKLDGQETLREFAAEFTGDHPLRRSAPTLEGGEDALSPRQLNAEYGASLGGRIAAALSKNEEFVCLDGRWFLRGLLPEVPPFQLNIAEAIIDERRQPVALGELFDKSSQVLDETGMPSAEKKSIRAYALAHALSRDPRFVEISSAGASAWYLSNSVPEAVRHKPSRLAPAYPTRGGAWLNRELRDFTMEILDEADELAGAPPAALGSLDSVQVVLTYPHRREGTLPLSKRALGLLSEKPPADRFMVTFIDQSSKETMQGWMVPDQGYAWGLAEWYRRHELPIGSIIEVRRGDGLFTFVVSCEDRKRKSDWIREAKVMGGRLVFGIQRKAYMCRYDKHLLIDEGNVGELDRLWVNSGAASVDAAPEMLGLAAASPIEDLFDYLTKLFPELAKLSGQGLVHAKALYSALNLTRRCGTVPIFAELTRRACFDPVGDGNWVYDESLRHVTYSTEEEMSRRPRSHRQDLIVDRVYPYGIISSEGKSS